tara:strand:+ start:5703 stop:6095 length:393 start_codon:yes stop_codon:yes gene_type:complete
METTLFLAQFLGLFSIILSVAIILRRKMIVHVIGDFLQNRTLAFVVGIAEMATGLLLVLLHSSWNGPLETALSALGWLLLLEGIFYLFATKKLLRQMIGLLDNVSAYYFFAVLYLLLGVYLVKEGFSITL